MCLGYNTELPVRYRTAYFRTAWDTTHPVPQGYTAVMSDQEDGSPAQLPNHKVKYKKPLQRACNEKNDKGKFCGGHLKRWFYLADVVEQGCGDVRQSYGDSAEVYRCEHCKTLYLPNAEEPRGKNVAGVGKLSIFGVTVVPKTPAGTAPMAEEAKE
jgi:hypothetical protein